MSNCGNEDGEVAWTCELEFRAVEHSEVLCAEMVFGVLNPSHSH